MESAQSDGQNGFMDNIQNIITDELIQMESVI